MKNIKLLIILLFIGFSCKKEEIAIDVTSVFPDLRNDLNKYQGFKPDLTYNNIENDNRFIGSNSVRFINYLYNSRKIATESYEIATSTSIIINWNKEREILFVNFGSFLGCDVYSGRVYYGATVEKVNSMAQEPITLENGWSDEFFKARLKEETDNARKNEIVKKYLITKSCKQ